MKKILTHPGFIIAISYLIMMFFLINYIAFVNGKENWNQHIDEIQSKNLVTDAEISCIMYKYGFAGVDLIDDPTVMDFITSGYSDVPNYCKSCIDVQN